MTLNVNGAESFVGPFSATNNGNTITGGTGEASVIAGVGTGCTITADTTLKASGTKSYKMTPASGQVLWIRNATALGAVAGAGAADVALNYGALSAPTAEAPLLAAQTAAGATLFTANWITTGFLRLRSSGAVNLWTSSVAFAPSAFLRVGMAVKIDVTTPANSQVRLAVFPLGSDTPITGMDSGWVTAAPSTTGAGVDRFLVGRPAASTDTAAFNLDDFRWDAAATDLLPAGGSSPLAVTGVMSGTGNPPSAAVNAQRTLTLTATGGNGSPITFGPVNWGDGLAADAAVTPAAGVNTATFTRTPATAGLGKTWSAPWSQV